MFCPNCGLQQPDATKFCQRCGTDLTKKRSQYEEISAGATPDYVAPTVEEVDETTEGEEILEVEEEEDFDTEDDSSEDTEDDGDEYDEWDDGEDEEPEEGYQPPLEEAPAPAMENVPLQYPYPTGQPIPPMYQAPAEPQRLIITQKPKRLALPNLFLRRLICFPTFIGCLGLGAFSFISTYEEIVECIDKFKEPSFGWATLAVMVIIVGLGALQSLIGMGTIYSSSALTCAFLMSAICAFAGLNYMPGTWKERLLVFCIFAFCAFIEAISAIGPIEKKPKKQKQPEVKPEKPARQQAKTTSKTSRSGTSKSGAKKSSGTSKPKSSAKAKPGSSSGKKKSTKD